VSIKIQTLREIRKLLSTGLSGLYPSREIESLFNVITRTVLYKDRLHNIADNDIFIENEQFQKIVEIINQLKTGKPIQYILGETTFYGCTFKVNEHVLVPRQETEELVDLIIRENRGINGRIIDIGTGSGCIAVTLARNLGGAEVKAIDISSEAVEIARQNAALNNVMVDFITADIFNIRLNNFYPANIIVSNPPYVRESEKAKMHSNVVDFEPHMALFVSDSDPLAFYRRIMELAEYVLIPGGKVYFEINESLGYLFEELMKSHRFMDIAIIKDLNNKERFVKGTFNG
jgi:release factor glutamine methyltransferase